MLQLHPDKNFHYEALRSLGVTRYYGGDINEQLAVLQEIPVGDFEAWYDSWSRLAQRVLATIDQSRLSTYAHATIRDVYFRASHYQFVSDFFLHGNQGDLRLRENYTLWRKWFDVANAHLPIPGQHIDIPTPHGFTVPSIFYRTAIASAKHRRPTLIVHGGFDSNLEEILHVFGFAGLERDYNVLLFEGPGQPGLLQREQIGWIAEWEKVVTPVVDYVLAHADEEMAAVDTKKIGLVGLSLGGYLSARAAAFEPRLAAVMCVDGVWSFEQCVLQAFPGLEEPWRAGDETGFNRVFEATNSTGQRWIHDHLLYSCQASNGWEAMQKVVKHMTLEGCADQIKMPAFIGLAKHDLFFTGQPERVAAMIGPNAHLAEFGDDLAAGEHCASGALGYLNQRVFEWFAGVVGH